MRSAACFLLVLTLALSAGEGRAVTVGPERIADAVTGHVRSQVRALQTVPADAEIRVEIARVPGGPFDFPGVATADAVAINAESALEKLFSNRAVVRVQMAAPMAEDGSRQVRQIGVPVKISVVRPVWVVKNPVAPGQALNPADFSLLRRELSDHVATAVGTERDLRQYSARLALHPGEVLDARKMVRPPDVRRNGDVRILLVSPDGLRIVLDGLALQDGRVGETIRVRQQRNRNKTYTARIIDRNRVQVDI